MGTWHCTLAGELPAGGSTVSGRWRRLDPTPLSRVGCHSLQSCMRNLKLTLILIPHTKGGPPTRCDGLNNAARCLSHTGPPMAVSLFVFCAGSRVQFLFVSRTNPTALCAGCSAAFAVALVQRLFSRPTTHPCHLHISTDCPRVWILGIFGGACCTLEGSCSVIFGVGCQLV